MTTSVGWDDARTARAYERFCRRHRRYRIANEALVAHAALAPGQRVLDVGAGTGRTAESVLPHIGGSGTILCVEPARAMREAAATRLRDRRITWTSSLPEGSVLAFDRVVCGAAIWQLLPLQFTFRRLAAVIAPGGALVFNIPAHYLLEPDRPGGGRDPLLLELLALVERDTSSAGGSETVDGDPSIALPHGADEMARLLTAIGLRVERWSFEVRLTQAAYRDWLKIPPVSEGLFGGLAPDERERRLDVAYRRADHGSWRWERWLGWTAWRIH
jgi:SAM-dependent methyltransferase